MSLCDTIFLIAKSRLQFAETKITFAPAFGKRCFRIPKVVFFEGCLQPIPERCPSGLRSAPGKCVYVKSVSRVRIPVSPPHVFGEVAEWSIVLDSKSSVPPGTVGSNPTLSAEMPGCDSSRAYLFRVGSVAECVPTEVGMYPRVPWVRIPPSPQQDEGLLDTSSRLFYFKSTLFSIQQRCKHSPTTPFTA